MHNSTFRLLTCLGLLTVLAGCAVNGSRNEPTTEILTAQSVRSVTTTNQIASPSASSPTIPSPEAAAPTCTEAICIPAGAHTTTGFLGGHLTVTVAQPWQSGEDQPAEFSAAPANSSGAARLLFWMDILPVDPAGHRVDKVPRTAAATATWLSKRQNVRVTRARPATVGAAHLPATVVDISIARTQKMKTPAARPAPA